MTSTRTRAQSRGFCAPLGLGCTSLGLSGSRMKELFVAAAASRFRMGGRKDGGYSKGGRGPKKETGEGPEGVGLGG